jgi:hypothetical protein
MRHGTLVSLTWAGIGLLAAGANAQTSTSDKNALVNPVGVWEIRRSGGKLEKVTVLEDTLTLETSFGTLKIPSKEVRRVEFGVRYSDDDKRRITSAIDDVLAPDIKTRERGKDSLLEIGAKAYPLVQRETKSARANPHLFQILDKLKAMISETDGELRDFDLVLTADDSKFAGRLGPDAIRVKASDQEQVINWSEVRVMVNGGSAALEEKLEIVVLGQFGIQGLLQTHFEKVVGVQVTGQVGGSVWGSGPYTSDSSLAAAAVHAGVLKVGETAVIKIRVKADPGGYTGSTQNGVTSSNYGPWQGCYEILGKQKK